MARKKGELVTKSEMTIVESMIVHDMDHIRVSKELGLRSDYIMEVLRKEHVQIHLARKRADLRQVLPITKKDLVDSNLEIRNKLLDIAAEAEKDEVRVSALRAALSANELMGKCEGVDYFKGTGNNEVSEAITAMMRGADELLIRISKEKEREKGEKFLQSKQFFIEGRARQLAEEDGMDTSDDAVIEEYVEVINEVGGLK